MTYNPQKVERPDLEEALRVYSDGTPYKEKNIILYALWLESRNRHITALLVLVYIIALMLLAVKVWG